jgi:hypothetical protein
MRSKKFQNNSETSTRLNAFDTASSNQNTLARLLAHKTYLFTSAVGLLAPLLIVFLFSSAASLFEAVLFFVVIIISAIYLFYAFSRMLMTRFEFYQIRFPANLLFFTLSIYIGLTIFFMLFVGHHPQGYHPDQATWFDLAGYYTSILAAFGLSTSLILMSFELENLPDNLHGLLKPLRYALLSLSMFLILDTLAIVTSYLIQTPIILALSIVTIRISDVLLMLSLSINCILISLIFLFFAIRDVVPPAESP